MTSVTPNSKKYNNDPKRNRSLSMTNCNQLVEVV